VAQVAITFNKRTYRFQCAEADVERLEVLANYLKIKLDGLMQEHGALGDERLVLMAALMIADELFDARADIDDLLDGQTDKLKDVVKSVKVTTAVVKPGIAAPAQTPAQAGDDDTRNSSA
jgi:cell division protein ZapA